MTPKQGGVCMKLDSEKIMRKQREKKAAILIAARRYQKQMERNSESILTDKQDGNNKQKNK